MTDLMHFAFIDESGTVGVPGGTHFLVVALLNTGQPRTIELPVRRALKKYGPSLIRRGIKAANQDLPQKVVLIRQENSTSRKELQAVDAVAWALFQKYERDNTSFYHIISPRMVYEEVVREKDWSK